MLKKISTPLAIALTFIGLILIVIGVFSVNTILWFMGALLLSAIAAILVLFITPNERSSMKITKLRTVSADQILEDCPHILVCFDDADFNVSFGDANHTLVDREKFDDMLNCAGVLHKDLNGEQTPIDMEMKKVYDRLDSLKKNVLIDLGS